MSVETNFGNLESKCSSSISISLFANRWWMNASIYSIFDSEKNRLTLDSFKHTKTSSKEDLMIGVLCI